MRSSTLVTPTLSVAAAVKVTLPDTVLLGRSYGSQRRRGVRSHVLHPSTPRTFSNCRSRRRDSPEGMRSVDDGIGVP
jgi:hypothetical protein